MKHRRFKLRQIWRDRLPLTKPECLTGAEWAALLGHVEAGMSDRVLAERIGVSVGDVRELRNDASAALLMWYAFESDPNRKGERG